MFNLFKKLNKKQSLIILVSIVFIAFQVYLDLKLPDYMQEITSLLQSSSTKIKDILIPGGKMLSCAFLSLLGAFITGYLTSLLSSSFSKNLRSDIFRKVNDLEEAKIKGFTTSSLITRTTNDVTQIQMFLSMGLQLMIKAPIMAVWAIIKIVNKNLTWSMVTGGAVLLLLIMIIVLVIFVLPKFKIIQTLTDNLNRVTRENLIGIRVIRAFNAEDYQNKKFNNANDDLMNTSIFTGKLMSIISPGMTFISSILTITIYLPLLVTFKLLLNAIMMLISIILFPLKEFPLAFL